MPALAFSFRSLFVAAAFAIAILSSGVASAAISVQVTSPASDSIQAGPIDVSANVTSTFQLQSVVAQVDTASIGLTYQAGSTWTGSLSLTSLSTGPKTLTVTATDVYGATGSSAVPFRYRHPPTVVIDEPVWGQVVGPTVRVSATCVDETPSTCTVKTGGAGGQLPMALEHLDTVIDVAPGWWTVYVNVINDAGQTGGGEPLYIYSARSLMGLRAIGCAPGQILDFDASRLLYRLRNDILVADRRTGGTTLLFPKLPLFQPSSLELLIDHLGSNNILFAYDPDFGTRSRVKYDVWRAGSVLPEADALLGTFSSFAVGGDRAVHTALNSTSRIAVTDLTNGTDVELPETSITAGPLLVTRSGAVYYSISFQGGVGRWVDGVTTHLTDREWMPVASDDINLVVQSTTAVHFGVVALQGNADGGVTAFAIDQGPIFAAGGWLAFSRVPDAGPAQVWSRSPAGMVAQVSFFGAGASAEALSDTGEVAMRTGNGERWIGRAGAPPAQVGSDGTIRWWNGQWYVNVARMLFRFDSSCTTGDSECGPNADAGPFSSCPAFGGGDDGGRAEDSPVDVANPRGAADVLDASVGPFDASDGGAADNPAPPEPSGCGGCRLSPDKPHGRASVLFLAALATLAKVRRQRRNLRTD